MARAHPPDPPSQTTTIHTLVDESGAATMRPSSPRALESPADDLHKATSRTSRLDVVDPQDVAEECAPPDVVWVEWDGPECVPVFVELAGRAVGRAGESPADLTFWVILSRSDPANPLNWSRRRKVRSTRPPSAGGEEVRARRADLPKPPLPLLPPRPRLAERATVDDEQRRHRLLFGRLDIGLSLQHRRRLGRERAAHEQRALSARRHDVHSLLRRASRSLHLTSTCRSSFADPQPVARRPQAAPLLLAPLSEVYGRSSIYLGSAIVFALFFIPQALAPNIATMLVARFISGCAGSTAVALVGGTIADVWRADERGTPMALFSFAAFGGASLSLLARAMPKAGSSRELSLLALLR